MKSRHTGADEPQPAFSNPGRTMTEKFDETRPSAPIDRRSFIERIAAVAALTSVGRGVAVRIRFWTDRGSRIRRPEAGLYAAFGIRDLY